MASRDPCSHQPEFLDLTTAMTKEKISSDCKKEAAVGCVHKVNTDDLPDSEDEEVSDQGGSVDSQPNVDPEPDIDDGSPLAI